MTLDEFRESLEGAGHRWNIDRLNMVRDESWRCPICSLARDRGWRLPGSLESPRSGGNAWWDDAAEYLGLKISDARRVVDAADNLDGPPTATRTWLRRMVDAS